MSSNPCLSCGACCAHFRVSFYWAETDAVLGGTVPVALTTPVNHHLVAMKGTVSKPVHCIALEEGGRACRLLDLRPTLLHLPQRDAVVAQRCGG